MAPFGNDDTAVEGRVRTPQSFGSISFPELARLGSVRVARPNRVGPIIMADRVLNSYQTWPHGYTALATLVASRSAIRSLHEKRRSFDDLVVALHANRGHLGIALRLLRVLEWVHARPAGELGTTGQVLAAAESPLHETASAASPPPPPHPLHEMTSSSASPLHSSPQETHSSPQETATLHLPSLEEEEDASSPVAPPHTGIGVGLGVGT